MPTIVTTKTKKERRKRFTKRIRVMPEPVENPTVLSGVRRDVFLDRYALKDEAGNPIEEYPEQMWRRVARGISQVEKNKGLKVKWERNYYKAMDNFKFVPGGRILSGAGTGFAVTYYNCYVLPSPEDSRDGILDNLKEMVEIMSRGGGVGINLSSLRPRGARVKKVNGFSSGPMNWAELYSVATHDIIQQGGTRRGALMLMLWDWHPDIEEFITVKQDLSKVNGANLSVCVSDRFMEAVKNNEDWPLLFPDLDDTEYDEKWDGMIETWIELGKEVKIYKTIKARKLWDMIAQAAWTSAEPGVVFMERYNKWHNNWYFNKINCVNPCVTGDTLVATSRGLRSMRDLYTQGKPFQVILGGRAYLSSPPFLTGKKRIWKLKTKEGYELKLTADHKVYTTKGKVEAGKLKKGDKLIMGRGGAFGSYGTLKEGRIWGWLVGDGAMKKKVATLFFYGNEKRELAPQFAQAISAMVADEGYTKREYPISSQNIEKEDKAVIESVRLSRIAKRLGFMHVNKYLVPDKVFSGSEAFQRGFLQGLFSSDGHVAGTPEKGVSVRLTSVSESLLSDTQKLLVNFGILSKIYKNRRKAQKRLLPGGKGGQKLYNTKAQHDLVISKQDLGKFAALIGFLQEEKQEKLRSLLSLYSRGPYRSRFLATFETLVEDGSEEVFDITVAEAHRFSANGIVVSNCGEEGLPAYGVCNLGSINLVPFVNESGKFDYKSLEEHVRVAVRFLDSVIDSDIYIFDEIRQTQLNGERRIGLGTMGLGDALIKMKVRYGSKKSLKIIDKIYKLIRDTAYDASSDLAKEKGAFPKFDAKKYTEGYFINALPEAVRRKIKRQGIRNSVLLMQAPTGSSSLLSGVTSGIEPVYEFVFIRRDRLGEHTLYHPLFEEWKAKNQGRDRPSYFVSAKDLTPEDHVRVQAAIQKYVDASISKTVNAPETYTVEDVKKLYNLAYELGCKGVTFMRAGSRPGVLERVTKEKEAKADGEISRQESEMVIADISEPLAKRPYVVSGATYRLQTPVGSAFVTINETKEGQPLEVFINVGKAGSDVAAMAEALGRSISTALRFRGELSPRQRAKELALQLSQIGGRRSVGFGQGRIRSLPDAISVALSSHYGFKINGNGKQVSEGNSELKAGAAVVAQTSAPDGEEITTRKGLNVDPTVAPAALPGSDSVNEADSQLQEEFVVASELPVDICPSCGSSALVYEEGCSKCYACGHSEC